MNTVQAWDAGLRFGGPFGPEGASDYVEGRWVEQSTRCSFAASRHWILVDLKLKSQATCLDLHLERAKHLQTRLRAEKKLSE